MQGGGEGGNPPPATVMEVPMDTEDWSGFIRDEEEEDRRWSS